MRVPNRPRPILALAAASLLGISARTAEAHFYWAQLTPGSDAMVRLVFTEGPSDRTEPTLLTRMQPVQAWTPDGKGLELRAGSGGLEAALPKGARVAGVSRTWGVVEREGQVFLLQYYAKAALPGSAVEAANLHLELFARQEGDGWLLSARHGSRPEKGADLTIYRPGEAEPLTLKTDDRGEARFTMAGSGLCAIRARAVEAESGSFEGKAYKEKRYYSTLTFSISGSAAATSPVRADPGVYALLKGAHDFRQTLPSGFAGFTADLLLDDNGTRVTGRLNYAPGNGVELTLEGGTSESQEWLRQSLSSIIGHRRGGDFAQGDGRHPITFGPDDRSPIGRQVLLNDPLQSSYRVQDNRITEVARTMGPQRFIITVLETQPGDGSRYLPRHFVVSYFNGESGALQESQSFTDTYAKVKGVWLPTSRRVVTAADGRLSTRRFELRNVRLTPPPSSASAASK